MADSNAIVLLGAGASAEAGVPTTFDMTNRLVERISQERGRGADVASALHFVCGAIIAHDAAEGRSPFDGLDVERVFAAVELLAERRTLEVTPFVASWHPAVDAWDEVRTSPPPFFDRNLREAILEPRGFKRPVDLITKLIQSETAKTPAGTTYSTLATRMLSELRQLVATTRKEVDYLRPIVAPGRRAGGLTIATLNYDLAIEQVARASRVRLTTGIDGWVADGRWSWPDKGVRLLKLHGSIDWAWQQNEPEDGHLPRKVVAVTDDPSEGEGQPALIFGQRGKLRAEGPFLGLLAEFEAHLARANRLVVVGYSFRDDHVNELLRRWTAEDVSRTILVVDPAWPEAFPYDTNDFRAALAEYFVPRNIEEPSFAPRLEIWREKCSDAAPRLFGTGRRRTQS